MSTRLPSLIDDLGPAQPAPRLVRPALSARLKAWWSRRMADPALRRSTITRLRWASGLAVLGLGLGLYFWLRPIPQPDYRRARLDRVMNYTLLTDEFNALPVEKRLELIGQLVQRLRDMNSGDSVMLAAFASGIAGAAREQLEENASRLAIDMWDKYAKDYDNVPAEGREQFLEDAFVDFQKTMEAMGGRPRNLSDQERVAEVREQARRDREALRDPENQPPPEAIGRIVAVMNRTLGGNASPAQRTRGSQMMRDMVRHFRNQDIATGRPK
jgi:hypothetical protein